MSDLGVVAKRRGAGDRGIVTKINILFKNRLVDLVVFGIPKIVFGVRNFQQRTQYYR